MTKSKDMTLSLLERTNAGRETELMESFLKKSPVSNFVFDECVLPDD
jgi:hypothetical protein